MSHSSIFRSKWSWIAASFCLRSVERQRMKVSLLPSGEATRLTLAHPRPVLFETLRFWVACPQTLEVRARQVVEQDVEGLVEQSPNPRLQMRLERRLVRQQLIQSPVEPVLVHLLLGHPADVLKSRLRVEALLNRKLRRGCDQPCRGQDEGHHWPRNLLPAPLHALLEQLVETQKPP